MLDTSLPIAGGEPSVTLRQPHFHAGISFSSRVVRFLARSFVRPAIHAWTIGPNLPWPVAAIDEAAGLLPQAKNSCVCKVSLKHCSAEWVRASGVGTAKAILYLHGGAFVTCGLNTHRGLVTRISESSNAAVLNVGYRMLPMNTISDAVEDALSGYRWLCEVGYGKGDIVIAGDSAGGYLAFMTTLAVLETDLPRPAGVVAISPLTDADPVRRRKNLDVQRCPLFPPRAVDVLARYIRRAQSRIVVDGEPGPLASPVDEDLSRMPPVMIHAGADELLRPDAELMSERLEAADVRCDLHLWEGQMHAFPVYAHMTPEGRRAIGEIGRFVREVTASRTSSPSESAAFARCA